MKGGTLHAISSRQQLFFPCTTTTTTTTTAATIMPPFSLSSSARTSLPRLLSPHLLATLKCNNNDINCSSLLVNNNSNAGLPCVSVPNLIQSHSPTFLHHHRRDLFHSAPHHHHHQHRHHLGVGGGEHRLAMKTNLLLLLDPLNQLLKSPPPPLLSPTAIRPREQITVDAQKMFRCAQLESLRTTLKELPRDSVPYPEFVEICKDRVSGSTAQQAMALARSLDQSGNVLVLGDTVFLRPEQVARAVERVVSLSRDVASADDPRKKELERMETEKEGIDGRAEKLVRRELWCGLGFLALQTVACMRLTFWELSWDVMEPICFFGTSLYFMAGYAFFLTTSRDPSFQEFFNTRFTAKQRRLMQKNNFDVRRFHELQKICDTNLPSHAHHQV